MLTEQLYQERLRRQRGITMFAVAVAIVCLLLFVNCLQRPPACGVRLLGDGTWERASGGSQLLDGCRLTTWEE